MNRYLKDLLKENFSNFFYFYYHLKHRVFIRVFLSLGVGFLDGFGLAMFLPLLQMVNDQNSVQANELGNLGFIVELLNKVNIQLNLVNVLLLLCFFFIFKGFIAYLNGIYEVSVRQYFVKKIRVSLTNDLSQLSYKSFVLADAGRIQNTLSGEVGRISQAYQNYFNTYQQVILVLVYMCFAFFIDARFAFLITVGGILTNFVFKRIYTSTKRASNRLTSGTNIYQSLIIQFVANFKYLKASGGLNKFNKKLLGSIYEIEENNRKIGRLGAIVTATREPLLILVVCAVIFAQVNLMNGNLGPILISLLFFYRALTATIQMQTFYNTFLSVSGTMRNLTEFEADLKHNKEKDGNQKIKRFEKGITVENVSFSYLKRPVLDHVNLKIEKNQTIAFVGESGSGKTTMVNLLVGLIPLDSGDMHVDGIDRKTLNIESFQSRIGYITQEPVIFDDTIFNNVTFWDQQTPQNFGRFQEALKKAAIWDYVSSLDKQGDERLGNNGVNISGGQKQRISIARELYKDIDILVLDEATSALDSETERLIQENIDALKGQYTILIVAHRLSTIKSADKVFLLNKGRIDAQGNYSELLDNSPIFRKMVSLQEL